MRVKNLRTKGRKQLIAIILSRIGVVEGREIRKIDGPPNVWAVYTVLLPGVVEIRMNGRCWELKIIFAALFTS